MTAIIKPTKAEVQAAYGKTLPDIIAPNIRVLFCGINPSLYSAAVGHHFARPGNRFWRTLHAAGFTDRLLSPFEDQTLLDRGYGLTNVVDRATARADELSVAELIAGQEALAAKAERYRPQYIAILGVSAYRSGFQQPQASMGRQEKRLADSIVWVLPNPSGLNAHYQLEGLAAVYRELFQAIQTN